MKRLGIGLGAALAGLLVGQAAMAADMPVKAAAIAAPVAPWSWTGFYVGAHIGHQWTRVSAFVPGLPGLGTAVADPDSLTVGGHAGFRYQFNMLVVGVEGDISKLDGRADGTFPGNPFLAERANTSWDASVRGTLGIAIDRTLIYATGGWSWLRGTGCAVDPTNLPAGCIAGSTFAHTADGWTAGGGIQQALWNWVILRLEYIYADYGTFTYNSGAGPVDVRARTQKVRLGASVKIGP